MKKTMEIWFEELGTFCERDLKNLKEKVKGSYYNLNVTYSNCHGNCYLGVTTDYDYEAAEMTKEEFIQEVKKMLIRLTISALYDAYRK